MKLNTACEQMQQNREIRRGLPSGSSPHKHGESEKQIHTKTTGANTAEASLGKSGDFWRGEEVNF